MASGLKISFPLPACRPIDSAASISRLQTTAGSAPVTPKCFGDGSPWIYPGSKAERLAGGGPAFDDKHAREKQEKIDAKERERANRDRRKIEKEQSKGQSNLEKQRAKKASSLRKYPSHMSFTLANVQGDESATMSPSPQASRTEAKGNGLRLQVDGFPFPSILSPNAYSATTCSPHDTFPQAAPRLTSRQASSPLLGKEQRMPATVDHTISSYFPPPSRPPPTSCLPPPPRPPPTSSLPPPPTGQKPLSANGPAPARQSLIARSATTTTGGSVSALCAFLDSDLAPPKSPSSSPLPMPMRTIDSVQKFPPASKSPPCNDLDLHHESVRNGTTATSQDSSGGVLDESRVRPTLTDRPTLHPVSSLSRLRHKKSGIVHAPTPPAALINGNVPNMCRGSEPKEHKRSRWWQRIRNDSAANSNITEIVGSTSSTITPPLPSRSKVGNKRNSQIVKVNVRRPRRAVSNWFDDLNEDDLLLDSQSFPIEDPAETSGSVLIDDGNVPVTPRPQSIHSRETESQNYQSRAGMAHVLHDQRRSFAKVIGQDHRRLPDAGRMTDRDASDPSEEIQSGVAKSARQLDGAIDLHLTSMLDLDSSSESASPCPSSDEDDGQNDADIDVTEDSNLAKAKEEVQSKVESEVATQGRRLRDSVNFADHGEAIVIADAECAQPLRARPVVNRVSRKPSFDRSSGSESAVAAIASASVFPRASVSTRSPSLGSTSFRPVNPPSARQTQTGQFFRQSRHTERGMHRSTISSSSLRRSTCVNDNDKDDDSTDDCDGENLSVLNTPLTSPMSGRSTQTFSQRQSLKSSKSYQRSSKLMKVTSEEAIVLEAMRQTQASARLDRVKQRFSYDASFIPSQHFHNRSNQLIKSSQSNQGRSERGLAPISVDIRPKTAGADGRTTFHTRPQSVHLHEEVHSVKLKGPSKHFRSHLRHLSTGTFLLNSESPNPYPILAPSPSPSNSQSARASLRRKSLSVRNSAETESALNIDAYPFPLVPHRSASLYSDGNQSQSQRQSHARRISMDACLSQLSPLSPKTLPPVQEQITSTSTSPLPLPSIMQQAQYRFPKLSHFANTADLEEKEKQTEWHDLPSAIMPDSKIVASSRNSFHINSSMRMSSMDSRFDQSNQPSQYSQNNQSNNTSISLSPGALDDQTTIGFSPQNSPITPPADYGSLSSIIGPLAQSRTKSADLGDGNGKGDNYNGKTISHRQEVGPEDKRTSPRRHTLDIAISKSTPISASIDI